MVTLEQLAGYLQQIEPTIWGEVVRDAKRKLEVMAVSGAKDFFRQSRGPDGKPWAPLAHSRPNGGDKPLRDRGLLMASLSATVTEGQLKLSASSPGANLQNFGGRVLPKKGKRLAIPVSREGKRAGSPKNFPRALNIVGTTGATIMLGEMVGKKKQTLTVHYLLVKEVTVPRREFVGFSEETLQKMSTLLADDFHTKLLDKIENARLAREQQIADYYAANPLIS